jgi:hypothetical protein
MSTTDALIILGHHMNFDEMAEAVEEAEHTMRLLDKMANKLAKMLIGRLRHVNSHVLVDIKAELQGFNAHTKRWK